MGDTTAVQDFSAATMAHRTTANNSATPYLRPRHELVTWYTYNSFQQPVAQHYPDGGTPAITDDKGALLMNIGPLFMSTSPLLMSKTFLLMSMRPLFMSMDPMLMNK